MFRLNPIHEPRASTSVTREHFPANSFPPKAPFFLVSFYLHSVFLSSIQRKPNPNAPQSLSEDVWVGRRSRLLQRPSARRR